MAWRRIADPISTAFERREVRNHIKESDEELRYYLGMMSERLRFQARAVEDVGDSFAKIKFRLLAARSGVAVLAAAVVFAVHTAP